VSDNVEVTYEPLAEPLDLGWQNSSSGWFHTVVFGYYRVRLGNGWMFLWPHQGSPGTMGAEPIDLDLNPEYRAHLIERAERSRTVEA